ncbi:MAG: sensor histidine kinase [Bilifractor sp.]
MSFIVVMIFMGGLIYLVNLQTTAKESRSVIDRIIENDGDLTFSDDDDTSSVSGTSSAIVSSSVSSGSQTDTIDDNGGFDMSSENIIEYFQHLFYSSDLTGTANARYSTRYLSVLFDENDNVEAIKMNYIAAVDDEEAVKYAWEVREKSDFGSYGGYYYEVAERENGGTIVVFLDRSELIVASNRILYTVMILLVIGTVLAFFLLRALSFKLVQPEIENAERQKQFITNASHELKTPLSVIRANTEVEVMLNGENEWNQSTMRQVDHMTGLINNLVAVSRAEEKEDIGDLEKINVSEVITDTCNTFEPVATQGGKTFVKQVTPDLTMIMSESKLRQLAGLLIDNAIKYCDDGGEVRVNFSMSRRVAHLAVSNNYAAGAKVDYQRFFDRFYREDSSRKIDDKKKGGYGVGLSIAQGIVKQFDGDINASWKAGIITFSCTLREPAEKAVREALKTGGREAASDEIRSRMREEDKKK